LILKKKKNRSKNNQQTKKKYIFRFLNDFLDVETALVYSEVKKVDLSCKIDAM
jgi:hypothetical protein